MASWSRFHVRERQARPGQELAALLNLRQSKHVGTLGISRRAPLQGSRSHCTNFSFAFANDYCRVQLSYSRESRAPNKTPPRLLQSSHCSFAYSALACFRMGMSGSASFQRVRKSL